MYTFSITNTFLQIKKNTQCERCLVIELRLSGDLTCENLPWRGTRPPCSSSLMEPPFMPVAVSSPLSLTQTYHRGMQFLLYTVRCERREKKNRKYQEETTWCSKEQIEGISGTISFSYGKNWTKILNDIHKEQGFLYMTVKSEAHFFVDQSWAIMMATSWFICLFSFSFILFIDDSFLYFDTRSMQKSDLPLRACSKIEKQPRTRTSDNFTFHSF